MNASEEILKQIHNNNERLAVLKQAKSFVNGMISFLESTKRKENTLSYWFCIENEIEISNKIISSYHLKIWICNETIILLENNELLCYLMEEVI